MRSYDPQIGRFLQNDPYDQFASGYVGMGNDPGNMTDKDGGFAGMTTANSILLGAVGGAIVGGAVAGFSGGDPLKGALFGAVGGAAIGLGSTFNWAGVGNGVAQALPQVAPSLAVGGIKAASIHTGHAVRIIDIPGVGQPVDNLPASIRYGLAQVDTRPPPGYTPSPWLRRATKLIQSTVVGLLADDATGIGVIDDVAIPVLEVVNGALLIWDLVQITGERNKAARADGTPDAFKKLKPHPTKPNKCKTTDSNGKEKEVAKPEGFDAWWNTKHPPK